MTTQIQVNEGISAYGLKNNQVVCINEVDRGLECNCVCLGCGTQLIARKGDVNAHHFAHYESNDQHCSESILHQVSKKIIECEKMLSTGIYVCEVEGFDLVGGRHSKKETIDASVFHFDQVILECSEGDFRPDATGYYGLKKLNIEIVVTHDVTQEKYEKVENLGIPMLRIDMSKYSAMNDIETLTNAVLYDAPRSWVYHPDFIAWEMRLQQSLNDEIEQINQQMKLAVMDTYQLIDKDQAFIITKPYHVLVLGYNSALGHSRKYGRDFDFSCLYIGEAIGDQSSSNYQVRSCRGFKESKIDFDESLLPALEKLNYPCVMELDMKGVLRNGRAQNLVVNFSVI